MPRVSDIAILNVNERHTLGVRKRTRVEALPQLIGETYARLTAYLEELGEWMADVPFVAYHNLDMQDLDVEVGFVVRQALPEKGDLQPGIIPAGKQVFCMFRGPYSDVAPTYGEMVQWIGEHGVVPCGTSYEFYYNGMEFPPSELLTKILMPVQ